MLMLGVELIIFPDYIAVDDPVPAVPHQTTSIDPTRSSAVVRLKSTNDMEKI